MHEIDRIFTKYPFWATVRSLLTYLNQGFRQDATACVVWCASWSCRPSTRVQIPARSICSIRFGQIYCESCRLRGPIRFGAATSPTFQWRKVSWIWSQSWIVQRAKCCPGCCQTRWTPAFALNHWKKPSLNMASWGSWMRIKAAIYGRRLDHDFDQGRYQISMHGCGRHPDNIFIERPHTALGLA